MPGNDCSGISTATQWTSQTAGYSTFVAGQPRNLGRLNIKDTCTGLLSRPTEDHFQEPANRIKDIRSVPAQTNGGHCISSCSRICRKGRIFQWNPFHSPPHNSWRLHNQFWVVTRQRNNERGLPYRYLASSQLLTPVCTPSACAAHSTLHTHHTTCYKLSSAQKCGGCNLLHI